VSGALGACERKDPGRTRSRRGWVRFAVGGGEGGPRAFAEPESHIEKRRVDDRVERLRAKLDAYTGRALTRQARRDSPKEMGGRYRP
jgi:50S ribosomal subunit-associated GTPase HflX